MSLVVHRVLSHVEEVRSEMGREVDPPLRIAWVAAVVANPYPEGYVEDVVTTADALGEEIGTLLAPPVVALLDGHVEAYGKCALVGLGGEVEHGSALIHNLRFGNVFRTAAGGESLLPAAEKVGGPGTPIDVPIKHILDPKTRSHHQTVTVWVPDAPRDREIVLACVAANGGRPLARLAEFGAEVS